MKIKPVILATFISLVALSNPCSADLILDISGVFGSGVTNWKFSGTDIAGAPEEFNHEIPFFPRPEDSIFAEQGDMFKTTFQTGTGDAFVPVPTGVTITTPNGTRDLDRLYLNEVGVTDEIGMEVSGNTDLSFEIDDVVSWTGEFNLNIGLDEMNIGSYSNNYFAFIFFTLDLTVNISEDSAGIPEPSSFLVVSMLGAGLISRRRRKTLQSLASN